MNPTCIRDVRAEKVQAPQVAQGPEVGHPRVQNVGVPQSQVRQQREVCYPTHALIPHLLAHVYIATSKKGGGGGGLTRVLLYFWKQG